MALYIVLFFKEHHSTTHTPMFGNHSQFLKKDVTEIHSDIECVMTLCHDISHSETADKAKQGRTKISHKHPLVQKYVGLP